MARRISVEIVGDARSLERAFGKASKSGSAFGRTLATLGKVGLAGAAGGMLAFGLALRAGFSELAEAQRVAGQTRAVLLSTRGAANVSAKQVDKLATAISRMTGIDDEAVASAENLLLTFTMIKNEAGKGNDVFDQATKVTVDMATALGMDLTSAAMMVGKALNQMDVTAQGNVRGFMALRRVGVQITPQMMKQAKAFIAAGKPMEAQKLLLRELNTEFGGSARAFGNTLPGAMGKLKNALDEVLAAFASGFLPVVLRVSKALTSKLADPAFVARVQRLGTLIGTTLFNAFAKVGSWFVAHWPQIRQGFSIANSIVRHLATAFVIAKQAFVSFAKVALTSWRYAFIAPLQIVLKILSALVTGFSKLPFIGGKFKGAKDAINEWRDALGEAADFMTAGNAKKKTKPTFLVKGPGGKMVPPGPMQGKGARSTAAVYLDGRQVGHALIPHLQRAANSTAAQTRGRHGGSNLALG